MKLLALETATEACSVALWCDGQCQEEFLHAPRQQTQLLLPMIDRLLAGAGLTLSQLDAIAYSRGPGAFTGVRIAAAAAQGLAFGADIPVLPISTLQATAQGVWRLQRESQVVTVFDARMNEVYVGAYGCQGQLMAPIAAEQLLPPEHVSLSLPGDWFGAGNGWSYASVLTQRLAVTRFDESAMPHAFDVAVLAVSDFQEGKALAPELALPVYLRDEVWKKLPGR